MDKFGIDWLNDSFNAVKSSPFTLDKDGKITISTSDYTKNPDFYTMKSTNTYDNGVNYYPAAQLWTVCTP